MSAWLVRYDTARRTKRGIARGIQTKRFAEETAARRYFTKLCALGVPRTWATCKPEWMPPMKGETQ